MKAEFLQQFDAPDIMRLSTPEFGFVGTKQELIDKIVSNHIAFQQDFFLYMVALEKNIGDFVDFYLDDGQKECGEICDIDYHLGELRISYLVQYGANLSFKRIWRGREWIAE